MDNENNINIDLNPEEIESLKFLLEDIISQWYYRDEIIDDYFVDSDLENCLNRISNDSIAVKYSEDIDMNIITLYQKIT